MLKCPTMSFWMMLDQSLSGIKLLAELSGWAVEFLTRALKAPVHLLMGTLLDLSN